MLGGPGNRSSRGGGAGAGGVMLSAGGTGGGGVAGNMGSILQGMVSFVPIYNRPASGSGTSASWGPPSPGIGIPHGMAAGGGASGGGTLARVSMGAGGFSGPLGALGAAESAGVTYLQQQQQYGAGGGQYALLTAGTASSGGQPALYPPHIDSLLGGANSSALFAHSSGVHAMLEPIPSRGATMEHEGVLTPTASVTGPQGPQANSGSTAAGGSLDSNAVRSSAASRAQPSFSARLNRFGALSPSAVASPAAGAAAAAGGLVNQDPAGQPLLDPGSGNPQPASALSVASTTSTRLTSPPASGLLQDLPAMAAATAPQGFGMNPMALLSSGSGSGGVGSSLLLPSSYNHQGSGLGPADFGLPYSGHASQGVTAKQSSIAAGAPESGRLVPGGHALDGAVDSDGGMAGADSEGGNRATQTFVVVLPTPPQQQQLGQPAAGGGAAAVAASRLTNGVPAGSNGGGGSSGAHMLQAVGQILSMEASGTPQGAGAAAGGGGDGGMQCVIEDHGHGEDALETVHQSVTLTMAKLVDSALLLGPSGGSQDAGHLLPAPHSGNLGGGGGGGGVQSSGGLVLLQAPGSGLAMPADASLGTLMVCLVLVWLWLLMRPGTGSVGLKRWLACVVWSGVGAADPRDACCHVYLTCQHCARHHPPSPTTSPLLLAPPPPCAPAGLLARCAAGPAPLGHHRGLPPHLPAARVPEAPQVRHRSSRIQCTRRQRQWQE